MCWNQDSLLEQHKEWRNNINNTTEIIYKVSVKIYNCSPPRICLSNGCSNLHILFPAISPLVYTGHNISMVSNIPLVGLVWLSWLLVKKNTILAESQTTSNQNNLLRLLNNSFQLWVESNLINVFMQKIPIFFCLNFIIWDGLNLLFLIQDKNYFSKTY